MGQGHLIRKPRVVSAVAYSEWAAIEVGIMLLAYGICIDVIRRELWFME
jgi:hypothetical protein|uniref:Uncharacterized protein n=1 Tax=Picea glauca TaxID=3330 RepID=A0A101M5B8_PICGL|nr:hypothetical protein ABT39_MTgene1005 [Picea glauca]